MVLILCIIYKQPLKPCVCFLVSISHKSMFSNYCYLPFFVRMHDLYSNFYYYLYVTMTLKAT